MIGPAATIHTVCGRDVELVVELAVKRTKISNEVLIWYLFQFKGAGIGNISSFFMIYMIYFDS